jgi:hypothetical protein
MLDRRRFLIVVAFLIGSSAAINTRGGGILGAIGNAFKKLTKWVAKSVTKVISDLRRNAIRLAMHAAPSSFYFERPKLDIRAGDAEYGGLEPVYFVNGVLTTRAGVEKDVRVLSAVLQRPVYAIYNPTDAPLAPAVQGAAIGVYFGGPIGMTVGWLAGAVAGRDVLECLMDTIWTPPLPQHSPAARQVAHLIYNARRPISIVTHSQGCIQTLNGALTVSAYGYETRVANVRWVATGFDLQRLVDENRTTRKVNKFTGKYLVNDVIVMLSRGISIGHTPSIDAHTFAWWVGEGVDINERTRPTKDAQGLSIPDLGRGYASMIENSMLWPPGSVTRPKFEERTIEVQNLTRYIATARFEKIEYVRGTWIGSVGPQGANELQDYSSRHSHGQQAAPPSNNGEEVRTVRSHVLSQQIPPNSTAILLAGPGIPFQATRIALSIECNGKSTIYGDADRPLQVSTPYLADEMEAYPIVLEDNDSVTQACKTPFATTVRNGKETLWMGVDEQWAFTFNQDGDAGAYQQTAPPQNGRGYSDHFCYIDLLDPSGGVVMVPQSGTGDVLRILPNGQELPDCTLERFDPDSWPSNWRPIADDEAIVANDPQPRLISRQVASNPPLQPSTVKFANTHTNDLLVEIRDLRTVGVSQQLKIPAGQTKSAQLDRDSGGMIIETWQTPQPSGDVTREDRQIPVPAQQIYTVSVYELIVQSVVIDASKGGKNDERLEDVQYAPRSIGAFPIVAGDALQDSMIDVYNVADQQKNPGGVEGIDMIESSRANRDHDPIEEILRHVKPSR